MVFIRFRDSTSSEEFAEAYNGKAFNSVEVSHHLVLRFVNLCMVLARDMPCRPRSVYYCRNRGRYFHFHRQVRVVLRIYGLRTPNLPGLSGTNGFRRYRAGHRPLFAHIPLHVPEQVGRQSMPGLQILPNPSFISPDVI